MLAFSSATRTAALNVCSLSSAPATNDSCRSRSSCPIRAQYMSWPSSSRFSSSHRMSDPLPQLWVEDDASFGNGGGQLLVLPTRRWMFSSDAVRDEIVWSGGKTGVVGVDGAGRASAMSSAGQ